jgi:hypothetical protein
MKIIYNLIYFILVALPLAIVVYIAAQVFFAIYYVYDVLKRTYRKHP